MPEVYNLTNRVAVDTVFDVKPEKRLLDLGEDAGVFTSVKDKARTRAGLRPSLTCVARAGVRGGGSPGGPSGPVLPDAVRRPVRGPGFGARDRVALRRLAVAASFSAVGRGRAGARPLHTQRDPLPAAAGSSSCCVRLHPGDC